MLLAMQDLCVTIIAIKHFGLHRFTGIPQAHCYVFVDLSPHSSFRLKELPEMESL